MTKHLINLLANILVALAILASVFAIANIFVSKARGMQPVDGLIEDSVDELEVNHVYHDGRRTLSQLLG